MVNRGGVIMSNRMPKPLLASFVLLLAFWTASYAVTATTGHFSYSVSATNMTVSCNADGFPCAPTINGIPLAAGDEIAAVDWPAPASVPPSGPDLPSTSRSWDITTRAAP